VVESPTIERLAPSRFRVICPACSTDEQFDNIIEARVLRDSHVARHAQGDEPEAGRRAHLVLVEATPFRWEGTLADWRELVSALVLLRVRLGLTQVQVGGIMNVSSSTVSKIERQTIEPRFTTLIAYARALGVEATLAAARE
jgi:DNA-binding XRE family transcriptional regulator